MKTSREIVSDIDTSRDTGSTVHSEEETEKRKESEKTFARTVTGSQIGSSPTYRGPGNKTPRRGSIGR